MAHEKKNRARYLQRQRHIGRRTSGIETAWIEARSKVQPSAGHCSQELGRDG